MAKTPPPWMTPELEAKLERVRNDPIWEAGAWKTTFLCGYDFQNHTGLRDPALSWDQYLKHLRREAEQAWHRVGQTYLDRLFEPSDPQWKCWAETKFGKPRG